MIRKHYLEAQYGQHFEQFLVKKLSEHLQTRIQAFLKYNAHAKTPVIGQYNVISAYYWGMIRNAKTVQNDGNFAHQKNIIC